MTDPFQDRSLLLLGGVYDAMGEDYLRQGLRTRNVAEEEIEQIIGEIEQRQDASEEEG